MRFFLPALNSPFLSFQLLVEARQAASLTFILNNVNWDESQRRLRNDLPSTLTQSTAPYPIIHWG